MRVVVSHTYFYMIYNLYEMNTWDIIISSMRISFPELCDLVERAHEEEELDHGPREEHRRHGVLPAHFGWTIWMLGFG